MKTLKSTRAGRGSALRSRALRRNSALRAPTGRTGELATAASSLRIQSILVPIDFSKPSFKALRYAAVFAEQFGAKLTLLNVIEPFGTPDFIAAHPLSMENDKLANLSEQQLRGLAHKQQITQGLIEKTLVRTGVPFDEITSAARTLKADLIIISTKGHTGLKRLLLGSTTERVVRHATCPVLVVRDGEREFLA